MGSFPAGAPRLRQRSVGRILVSLGLELRPRSISVRRVSGGLQKSDAFCGHVPRSSSWAFSFEPTISLLPRFVCFSNRPYPRISPPFAYVSWG